MFHEGRRKNTISKMRRLKSEFKIKNIQVKINLPSLTLDSEKTLPSNNFEDAQ